MFRIDSTAFRASLVAAAKALRKSIFQAVSESARKAAEFARATTLFRDRNKQLRPSIRAKTLSPTRAQAIAGARHGAWVELGNTFRSGARYIYPKRAKFLRFEIDGQTIFARRVRASAPRPFMTEAGKKTEPLFDQLCRDAVDRMFG